MLHRLLAVIGYPAYMLNRILAGVIGRVGLGRVPGALVVGLALAALAATTASATLEAYGTRREPRAATISEVVQGRIPSLIWIVFDGLVIDGPRVASVEVFGGGTEPSIVERVYYLVADPAAPNRAIVVRAPEPVAALQEAAGPIRLDGTITEDTFSMGSLLADWDLSAAHPGLEVSESRFVAYGFATPWQEPSWIGAVALGTLAAIVLIGAALRQPILRRGPAGEGTRGRTPMSVTIHGELATPRGPLRLHGTPARLQWMDVEEVARTRWRYWGAALGDVRGDVEAAVRAHGDAAERLVVHGPTGSVIWPIDHAGGLDIEVGDAFLGMRRLAAIRIRGDGAAATLTFADTASRDAALAELREADTTAASAH